MVDCLIFSARAKIRKISFTDSPYIIKIENYLIYIRHCQRDFSYFFKSVQRYHSLGQNLWMLTKTLVGLESKKLWLKLKLLFMILP